MMDVQHFLLFFSNLYNALYRYYYYNNNKKIDKNNSLNFDYSYWLD